MRRTGWVAICMMLMVGVSSAKTLMSDTFSWGAGVTNRTSCTNGTSINSLLAETGGGTSRWASTGSAVFSGNTGYGNGKLTMTGSSSVIKIPVNPTGIGMLAMTAEGTFTPGTNGTRGFYMGLQVNTNNQLLINQATDKIYARVDQSGTVSLVSVVGGTNTTVTGSISFAGGDLVNMLLTLQMDSKLATLTVIGAEMNNRAEISLNWPGAGATNWNAFAVNATGTSTLELNEAGYYRMPQLPQTFPKNMSFVAFTQKNPSNEVVDTLAFAANYPIHHAPAQSYVPDLRAQDSNAVIMTGAAWPLPVSEATNVWPGYLLYYQGTKITDNLNTTDTKIYVSSTGCFRTDDHVIIYALTSSNTPNWAYFEYAQVTDIGSGWIKVQRATSGTTGRAFTNQQAVVAAHAAISDSQQWLPNFSLHSPTDQGINGAEFFAQRTAENFQIRDTDGTLYDGIEHDVFSVNLAASGRPMDCDNDLLPDWGYINGVNSFCLGIQKYTQSLRYLLGPDKIIQFDSGNPTSGYRGWKYVNGVQMEAFMAPFGGSFDRFSEAMEHLSHWASDAQAAPRFSYGFTKAATETYGEAAGDDWKFRVHFAAGLMNSMPHPYSSKQTDGSEWMGLFDWDEEYGGTSSNWSWLGLATGAAVRNTDNLGTNMIAGGTWSITALDGYGSVTNGSLSGAEGLCISVSIPTNAQPNSHGIDLRRSAPQQIQGDEYAIIFTAKGDDRWVVGSEVFEDVPRLIDVTVYGTPMAVMADKDWRTYTLTFVATNGLKLVRFGVGDTAGTNWIKNIELRKGSADRWSREFENGKVYLNMAQTPWTNNIETNRLWKLKGSITPGVNDGTLVTGTFVVPAKDALFLRKTDPN